MRKSVLLVAAAAFCLVGAEHLRNKFKFAADLCIRVKAYHDQSFKEVIEKEDRGKKNFDGKSAKDAIRMLVEEAAKRMQHEGLGTTVHVALDDDIVSEEKTWPDSWSFGNWPLGWVPEDPQTAPSKHPEIQLFLFFRGEKYANFVPSRDQIKPTACHSKTKYRRKVIDTGTDVEDQVRKVTLAIAESLGMERMIRYTLGSAGYKDTICSETPYLDRETLATESWTWCSRVQLHNYYEATGKTNSCLVKACKNWIPVNGKTPRTPPPPTAPPPPTTPTTTKRPCYCFFNEKFLKLDDGTPVTICDYPKGINYEMCREYCDGKVAHCNAKEEE